MIKKKKYKTVWILYFATGKKKKKIEHKKMATVLWRVRGRNLVWKTLFTYIVLYCLHFIMLYFQKLFNVI